MKSINPEDLRSKPRKEWQAALWAKFLEQFSDAQFRRTANALFSVYEKKIITNRLAAIALIRQGVSTREIERLLWLSRATISTLKKNLFGKTDSYGSQRLSKKSVGDLGMIHGKEINFKPAIKFLEGIDLLELLKNPPRPKGLGVTKRSEV